MPVCTAAQNAIRAAEDANREVSKLKGEIAELTDKYEDLCLRLRVLEGDKTLSRSKKKEKKEVKYF